jgi:A-factor type gamma-butyrolactone 1'-reductase (1S-forming)
MERFDGKVVIVTGATSGIGAAAATAFAEEGAKVIVCGRRRERGEALVGALRARDLDATYVHADVRSTESVAQLVAATLDMHGRLDFAVNNAGISGPNALLADYPDAGYENVIATNLNGVWLCMKHQIPPILRSGGGAIVNVASDFGVVGSNLGVAPYVASKHGVIGLTRAAALEYATQGLRVNALCPSFTETEMLEPALKHGREACERFVNAHIPLNRMARPSEMARAILWLCSPDASFVTGHALAADGGSLAR